MNFISILREKNYTDIAQYLTDNLPFLAVAKSIAEAK